MEALIGRLPDPEADRDALALLSDRENPAARQVAKRLQSRAGTYRQPLRTLLPGLDLLCTPLTARLSTRARKSLTLAGIGSWGDLAAVTPIALRHLPNVGAGTVEEIILLAMSEWASGFLPLHEDPENPLVATTDPPLELIGRSPDPEGDAQILRALLDTTSPTAQRFRAALRHSDWHQRPLRDLLPGLDLIEAPAFLSGVNIRAANALGRADLGSVADLAGVTPAQIGELPGVGPGTVESILAAVAQEWAAAYLRGSDGRSQDDFRARSGEPQKHTGLADLAGAFEKLESMGAFETFKRRRLENPASPARALATELQVSIQLIYAREATIERALASGMRKEEWPIRIAVEELRARLGSVARPQDLDEAKAVIDVDSRALPNHSAHRLALLLKLGEYRVTDQWILDRDIEELTRVVLEALSKPSADIDDVGRHLSRLGVREELQLPWLASRYGFEIVDGRLITCAY
ncbi:MAG: helix-hairpin-helix domain-containing protein [Solirubrobacterales bacterium]